MQRFGHTAYEPVWQRKQTFLVSHVPVNLRNWLFDPSSLTARLVEKCQGNFKVSIISQGWNRPMFNEAIRLGVTPDQMALVREVYLLGNNHPWVYARTVIPHSTLSGKQRYLAHLGNRPLGSVLFSDPGMTRDEVEVARIDHHHHLYETATELLDELPEAIWGRRSVFYTGKKPLLVNEVFLPSLLLE